jgi:hypothetical protein
VANTRVIDLNTNFVGLGRSDLNVFNAKLLSGLPGDGSLAGNGLQFSRNRLELWTQAETLLHDVKAGILTFPAVAAMIALVTRLLFSLGKRIFLSDL